MLTLEGVEAGYGAARILFGVGFAAEAGRITCLVGRNGAGKTTCLRAIMGLIPVTAGRVALNGAALSDAPAHKAARAGAAYAPQGRRLFAELTVEENLSMGLYARRDGARPAAALRDRALDLFPRLGERLTQRAETLSGGEQQMLAVARALCADPLTLLLDEPTEGLQPSMVAAIRAAVTALKGDGVAVLLVEQRLDAILALADAVVTLENGRVVDAASGEATRAAPEALAARLGV